MRTLTLCRYEQGKILARSEVDIDSTPYIAISHIWAQAVWYSDIPGISWEIIASPQKVNFLRHRLPALVGTEYFWMDILCVDQRSFEARIAVVEHIPAIYRGAQKTIVVREDGGFQDCCTKAIGNYRSWREDAAQNLATHIREAHLDGLVESWFDRLWPLQEAILSNHLQFTVCAHEKDKSTETDWDGFTYQVTFRRLFDGLTLIAQAWVTYGLEDQGSEPEYREFINAFLTNGSVSRSTHGANRYRPRPLTNDFIIHINSLRETSKPRDFILAILPQYGWYLPPHGVRQMTFGQLWLDCWRQAQLAGYPFTPTIPKGLAGSPENSLDSLSPSENIPTPTVLGDFVKLFGCSINQDEDAQGLFVTDVEVEEPPDDMESSLAIIEDSMRFSPSSWALAHRGELSQHGMFPPEQSTLALQLKIMNIRERHIAKMNDKQREEFLARKARVIKEYEAERINPEFYEAEAIKTLNAMWAGIFEGDASAQTNWEHFRDYLLRENPPFYQETMLRLSALVSCDVGISALSWTKPILRPLQTKIAGTKVLILATVACDPDQTHYICVQRGAHGVLGRDLALVSPLDGCVVGKIPDLLGDKTADLVIKTERLRSIYPSENILVYFTSAPDALS